MDYQYTLELCQQPIHARCCGFGSKDRRHIDPVPILQLYQVTENGEQIKVRNRSPCSKWIVHCDLYAEDVDEPRNLVHLSSVCGGGGARHKSVSNNSTILTLPSANVTKSLIGTLMSNAYELIDPHGDKGIFFIFDDLSVRIEGQYRLKFSLMDLTAVATSNQINIMDTIYSKPFKVYAPKYFPGIYETTDFSRCFANQGLKIAVRSIKEKDKGKRKEKTRTRTEQHKSSSQQQERDDQDDDEDNNDQEEEDNHRQTSSMPFSRIDISSVIHPVSFP
ncbi:velvet factor-domain-containing protein [Chlamydoabsidia padenii]|nr:velvet factor-domain-containing protein [Chlamydoabsidia padenii]